MDTLEKLDNLAEIVGKIANTGVKFATDRFNAGGGVTAIEKKGLEMELQNLANDFNSVFAGLRSEFSLPQPVKTTTEEK